MKIKEQLEEMLVMQKALNINILKEFGQDVMTEQKLQLAILDELGELTHELKGKWCWWKKNTSTCKQTTCSRRISRCISFCNDMGNDIH